MMGVSDLLAVWNECQNVKPAWFIQQGVPPLALAGDPKPYSGLAVAVGNISMVGPHRFEFQSLLRGVDTFKRALIIPARDEFGSLVDLVAWIPGCDLASWSGRVCLLGEQWACAPSLGEPLRVFPSALEWLRAGRRGVVVIEPREAAILLVGVPHGLLVDDPAFGFELRRMMTIAPRIVIRSNAMGRAA